MIVENLAKDIYVYKDIIDKDFNLLGELNKIFVEHNKDFQGATINDNEYNLELRSCTVFSLFNDINESHLTEYQKAKRILNEKIDSMVSKAIFDFIKKTGIKIKEREPWEILRYSETQKLTWHCDDGATHQCSISFVIYINDDYEGGEIEFRDVLVDSPYKPPAGSIVIFPSNLDYVHRVLPVTSGTKYSIISFGK